MHVPTPCHRNCLCHSMGMKLFTKKPSSAHAIATRGAASFRALESARRETRCASGEIPAGPFPARSRCLMEPGNSMLSALPSTGWHTYNTHLLTV